MPVKQTSVVLDKELYFRFKSWCAFNGLKSSDVFNFLMKAFISNDYNLLNEVLLCQKK